MPVDFGIDTNTGDVTLDANGNLVLYDGLAVVAQKIRLVLRTQKGTWWADTELGPDYQNTIFEGRVTREKLATIRAAIADEIFKVEEVTNIKSLELLYDKGSRRLTINFVAQTTEGALNDSVEI